MPTFRLTGHYFSMATIAVAELIRIFVGTWDFVGAAIGLQGPATARGWWDLTFRSELPYYYIFLAVLGILLVDHGGDRAPPLRLLSARHQGQRARRRAASACRCGRPKCKALVLSAAFTSVAGSLYVIKTGFIDPDSGFGILISVQMLIVAALGGAGTLFGPLVGALILIPLQTATNSWFGGGGSGLTYILYGGIIVVIARFEPGGLVRTVAPRGAAFAETPHAWHMLLEATNVSKAFGDFRAVAGADLAVDEGEIIGLIGPNGAGKSTFFNCLAGETMPTTGTDRVRRRGRHARVAGSARPRRHRPHLPGADHVRGHDACSHNVMVGAFLRHPHRNDAREHARRIVELTGLRGDQPARSLGTPGRKRLEIARVLATEPRLLLLDESLAGLTPTELQEAIALVRRIHEMGITIVIVEHIMEVIMTLTKRVLVFNQGHVIASGTPEAGGRGKRR